MKLHRYLGITQKSAWHLAHTIREAWEVDETYIRGKESSKHEGKKLNAGRGTVGKVAVAGIKDRESNQVSATVVAGTDAVTLQGFVTDRTEPDTMVCTDDAQAQMACQENAKRPSTASESL